MRNISFSMTTVQVRARIKDVTRRMGWENLAAGTILMACEKCQGLGKGGKIVKIGRIRVVSVERESLRRMLVKPFYGHNETTREGYPPGTEKHDPAVFIDFFCKGHKGCTLDSIVTRIEFEYLD